MTKPDSCRARRGSRTLISTSALPLLLFASSAGATPVFAPPVTYPTGSYPYGIAAGDLNEDGHQDLIVSDVSSTRFSTLWGNGDGTFAPSVGVEAGGTTASATVADLNGDGHLDVVVTKTSANSIAVFFGAEMGLSRCRATITRDTTRSTPTWAT